MSPYILDSNFFKDSSISINEYASLVSWANSKNNHFTQRAIEQFLDNDYADAWIISFAINQNIPILTHEKSEPERKSRIKIPDVCIDHGVNYFNKPLLKTSDMRSDLIATSTPYHRIVVFH